jgi:hypothetical protein
MASKAAADSGEGRFVAANTTDQRVLGKTRGASLDEAWLLMRTSYANKSPETRPFLQTQVKGVSHSFVRFGLVVKKDLEENPVHGERNMNRNAQNHGLTAFPFP